MFGERPLDDFLPALLADPAVVRAIVEEMPGIARDQLQVLAPTATGAVPEAGIRDLVADLVHNESTVVRKIDALGTAAGEFSVSVMRYGPVFWVRAPDFDDIGYFAGLEDAVSAATSNYEPFITAHEEALAAGVVEDELHTDVEEGIHPGCPYCASRESCEHHLLTVDLLFRTASDGPLYSKFNRAWSAAYEVADVSGTDVDEAHEFERCLDAISVVADAEQDYEFEGGPGQSTTYRSFFCSSKKRVDAAVARFNGPGE